MKTPEEIAAETAIENIKQYLREHPDISQAALARRARVGVISLNRVLQGKKGLGHEIAAKVAGAMGWTVGQIYSKPQDIDKEPHAAPEKLRPLTRDEMLARIVIGLPALNDLEMKNALALIEGSPSVKASGVLTLKRK